jgi:hypothetical protein
MPIDPENAQPGECFAFGDDGELISLGILEAVADPRPAHRFATHNERAVYVW